MHRRHAPAKLQLQLQHQHQHVVAIPPRTFYTLAESLAFESNPDIKIVYLTEKGIDLLAAVPDAAHIDYATRSGYSWDNIIHNPPSFMQKQAKQICIVETTEAELSAHNALQPSPPVEPDHKAEILARIDALQDSECTSDTIVDIIVDYLRANKITDFVLADEICIIVGNKGILKTEFKPESETNHCVPEPTLEPESDADTIFVHDDDESDVPDTDTTISLSDDDPEHSVSSNRSFSDWLLYSFDSVISSLQHLTYEILPIPTNTDWILLD